ncbi:MAG: PEGA domain-containing protein [Flavobacterium sp.]
MKSKLFTLIILFLGSLLNAQTVKISASEPDANIIVNGQNVGTGTYKLSLDKKDCYKIKVEKAGFLKYESTVCGKKAGPEPPSSLYFEMKKDDAEEASIKTDQANVDFQVEVNPDLNITEAWKLTTQIVTDYFDAIEVSDKETSYLRTAWSVQSFQQNTIRTRLIIKLSKSDPLTFKVKLNSEYSGVSGTSVKADEQFRDWDRILRKYKNVISDFSNRLMKK